MLRGCQREMIMLKTTDSTLFESAWLVLRQEKAAVGADDMMAEVNRIIGAGSSCYRSKNPKREKWLYFLGGLLFGTGIFALIWLLLR